jgi:hypothetical protein
MPRAFDPDTQHRNDYMVQEQTHACSPSPQRPRRRLNTPQYDAKFRGRNRRKFSIERLRIREIERLIEYRDGVVPDTDDADRPVWLVAQHMRGISPINLDGRLSQWCSRWAPYFPQEQIKKIADDVLAKPYFFCADTIGKLLGLKDEERKALGIRTIGAIDRDKKQRESDRAEAKLRRDRERALHQRRQRGVRPRSEYLRKSLSRTKPWEAEGISRRTWERHREARLAASKVANEAVQSERESSP